MKNTLITEILSEYSKMDNQAKIKILQQLEEETANYYNRPARLIVPQNSFNKAFTAGYSSNSPEFISVYNLSTNPLSAMQAICHEGYRAGIDDYCNDVCDLTATEKVDKKKLLFQVDNAYQLDEFIYNSEEPSFTALGLYEKQLARKESIIYLTQKLIDACENDQDCLLQFQHFYELLTNYNNIKMVLGIFKIPQQYNKYCKDLATLLREYALLIETDKKIIYKPNPHISNLISGTAKKKDSWWYEEMTPSGEIDYKNLSEKRFMSTAMSMIEE